MKNGLITRQQDGQAMTEYALLLALLAIIAMVALSFLSKTTSTTYANAAAALNSQKSYTANLSDFESRIMAYYNTNHGWPRSWSTFRFTDIGLNPADYQGAVNGVIWNPNGEQVGLNATAVMYVNDMGGVSHPIYVGQNVWCHATTNVCNLSDGTVVNISSLHGATID